MSMWLRTEGCGEITPMGEPSLRSAVDAIACLRGRLLRLCAFGVALDVALPFPGDSERAGRDVVGDHRARPRVGAVADLDRRHKRRVDADPHVAADRRAVLGEAVVIGGDRA